MQWRKFVMGRGARRYHAPGKIENRSLLTTDPRDPGANGAEGGGAAERAGAAGGRRRVRDGSLATRDRGAMEKLVPKKVRQLRTGQVCLVGGVVME